MRLPLVAALLHPCWNRCVQTTCSRSMHKYTSEKELSEDNDNERSSSWMGCHLRQEATRLRGRRDKYFSMASVAYKQGQSKLAKRLAEKGHQASCMMKNVNAQAASEQLITENVFSESNILNVHGLHVKEALTAISKFLNRYLHQQGKLTIITGWGRNSLPHPPRLLPAVKLFLNEHGYDFRETRPGVIEVSTWTS